MTGILSSYTGSIAQQKVRVGIGIFVIKEGKFLALQRQGSHGPGTWSVPGGHQEFGETFEATAHREIAEEVGLTIKNIRFGAITNDFFEAEQKHYVTIWLLSDWASGEASIKEPEKCLALRWVTFDELPQPFFAPWSNLLASPFAASIRRATAKK